jgi:hypothetical protein
MDRRLLVTTALLVGCGPPEAPRKLEKLCAYLFENARDGEDDELAAGLENLDTWLAKNFEEATDGYAIDQLSRSGVDALDNRSRTLEGLNGVAVASRIGHGIKPVVRVIAVGDATKVYGDLYLRYERDWDTNASCHVDQDCEWGEATIDAEADYGLTTVESRYRSEVRWVETEGGMAHIQRTWLLQPIEALGVKTASQFYLGVSLPRGGRTNRLQASWISMTSELPISDDTARNQTIKSLQDTEVDIDEWLDG